VSFRNEDGTLKHGVLKHANQAEADAYAEALEDEKDEYRHLMSTHPRVATKVLNVLCRPLKPYPDMDTLARELIAGEVKQPWLTYCREVVAWMKKNPTGWRPWHREFDAAIKRARG